MKRTHHMSINVKGALRKKAFKGYEDEKGKPVNPRLVEAMLVIADEEGKRVIPMSGEPCEGYSYETGCLGHEIKENQVI